MKWIHYEAGAYVVRQTFLPFLGYLLIQPFVIVAGSFAVHEEGLRINRIIKCWVFGQMILFASLQVMAVPFIILHWKFSALFWSYLATSIAFFGFCIFRRRKELFFRTTKPGRLTWISITLLTLCFILILYQSGLYLFSMHLDEDDARWLAQANDALEYEDMMTRDPDTGDYAGLFYHEKDVSSPWPMMYAVMSRILNTKTAIFTHTIYAPIQLILMYGIYWLIGFELFKKTEARIGFLLFVSVINLFFAETTYTQSVFSLVRIWQGKATVASIIIPLLLYLFICLNKRHMADDWIKVTIVGCAASLMSGMGVILPAVMISVFGTYYILAYHKWRHIPLFLLALSPSFIFGFVNMLLKR